MRRLQQSAIEKDIERKITFIVGPRQVGKTWLAKNIASTRENAVYLNYDHREDREIIREEAWLLSTELLVLDEIHKMPDWKQYLKGIFDTKPSHLKILVTGSARLDAFRQTGDSLAGRFFVHRLLPLSLAELKGTAFESDVNRLMARGGFPEPFLSDANEGADRWRYHYVDSLIRTDVLDFENIHNLRALQLLLELLRERVGAPLSYASLSRDIGVALNTVKKYVEILEALYIVFRVTPFSRNIARSLLKEPKLYFFDTGLVTGDDGARLENLVAVSLLKHVLQRCDLEGKHHELQYIRTKDGQEVDFCLVSERRPSQLLEVKTADHHLSKSLVRFHAKYGIPAIQLVKEIQRERRKEDIEIRDLTKFLTAL